MSRLCSKICLVYIVSYSQEHWVVECACFGLSRGVLEAGYPWYACLTQLQTQPCCRAVMVRPVYDLALLFRPILLNCYDLRLFNPRLMPAFSKCFWAILKTIRVVAGPGRQKKAKAAAATARSYFILTRFQLPKSRPTLTPSVLSQYRDRGIKRVINPNYSMLTVLLSV